MKCIPECGFNEKPDNITKLTRHLEECLDSGPCSKLKKEPFVIWKDGEFTVSQKKTKKDMSFEIDLVRKEKIQLKPTQIKTGSDYVQNVNVTQGALSDTLVEKPARRLKAEISDDLKR